MKCFVYSHKDFNELCELRGWNDNNIPSEIAFISICNTEECARYWQSVEQGGHFDEHWFKRDHSNVLNLDFDDIMEEEQALGELCGKTMHAKGLSDEQAAVLYKFILANKDKDFFIHCSAGKSRSQAVCKFIMTMYENCETRLDNPCLYPNVFVSNKLLRLFYKR